MLLFPGRCAQVILDDVKSATYVVTFALEGRALAQIEHIETPWQKVHRRFGAPSQAEFARILGKHRSKISRALRDEKGLISGRDQELIIAVAAERGVDLTSDDMTPALR